MSTLHSRSENIPTYIGIETLKHICWIVDYYKCTHAMQLAGDRWITGMGNTITAMIQNHETGDGYWIPLFLFFATALSNDRLFQRITLNAIPVLKGPIDTLLPIDKELIGKLYA